MTKKLGLTYLLLILGLELNEKYPLADYLSAANIKPGGTYSYHEVFNAVKSRIGGRNPGVQCEYDRETKLHTLAQIDICLSKDLDVIDCDQIHGGLNHNCPTHGKQVFYPDLKRVASSGKLWIGN